MVKGSFQIIRKVTTKQFKLSFIFDLLANLDKQQYIFLFQMAKICYNQQTYLTQKPIDFACIIFPRFEYIFDKISLLKIRFSHVSCHSLLCLFPVYIKIIIVSYNYSLCLKPHNIYCLLLNAHKFNSQNQSNKTIKVTFILRRLIDQPTIVRQ